MLWEDKFCVKTTNPHFGEFIERELLLPADSRMEVFVFDKNRVRKDEFLGSTVIELEQRYYNTMHGRCGLPYRYEEVTWRDSDTPIEVLEKICLQSNIGKPKWKDELTVEILGRDYCHAIKFDPEQLEIIKRELEVSELSDEILRPDVPVCCVKNQRTFTLFRGNISSLQ